MSRNTLGRPGPTVGVLALAVVMGVAYVVWLASGAPEVTPSAAGEATATQRPSRTPRPTRTSRPSATPNVSPTPTATPRPLKIGIVAGHWRSDAGAVCDDGLQEVTINLDVAARVVAILQHEGYDVDLLPEFAEELPGYKADAFVSIHADACNVPEASGFKVARVAASAIPEEEDRLVACLIENYAAASGLAVHQNSITYDMTIYHAFNEIDPETPGAIIELGFMAADRKLLTDDSFRLAQGIAQGIFCFLEGQ